MHREQSTACGHELLNEEERLVPLVEQPDLAEHGHAQAARERAHDPENKLPVGWRHAKEGAEVSRVRAALWAAQVQVDGRDARAALGALGAREQSVSC